MKTQLIAAISLSSALIAGAPALAQSLPNLGQVQGYGTLGYANLDGNSVDLGAVQGRLGARFGQYFGVEGELSGGVDEDHSSAAFGPPVKVGLRNQEAVYAVGYLPIRPGLDLFARAGYGGTDAKLGDYATPVTYRYGGNSWNYGAGGQYFFNNGPNGLRTDYTRYDFGHDTPDENVWSVAYVRKF